MSFSSWSDFFSMGGYAFYVWTAYGLTVVVLGGVLVAAVLRNRQLRRAIEQRDRLTQRQRGKP